MQVCFYAIGYAECFFGRRGRDHCGGAMKRQSLNPVIPQILYAESSVVKEFDSGLKGAGEAAGRLV